MNAKYSPQVLAELLGLPEPTAEQAAVIAFPFEPLLVVAGAGSGKTETMAARVVYLVANGFVRPAEILGLTFTRKAAGELRIRVQERLRALAVKISDKELQNSLETEYPEVSTYDSFSSTLFTENALRGGFDPQSKIISDATVFQIMQGILVNWEKSFEFDGALSTAISNAISLAAKMTEQELSAEQMEIGLRAELLEIEQAFQVAKGFSPLKTGRKNLLNRLALLEPIREYERIKKAHSLVTFADQARYAAELAGHIPAVGRDVRQRYRAVFLDEFQDTSVVQLELLHALFAQNGGAVTAVGDPNQAIYAWRGAGAASLAQFRDKFGSVGKPVSVLPLSISWRNDCAVLAAANRTVKPLNMQATGIKAGVEQNDKGNQREVKPGAPVTAQQLVARPGAGAGQVEYAYLQTEEEEAAVIANYFLRNHVPGVTRAVLCRKRRQIPAIENALRQAGIPVETVGTRGLTETESVRELLSILRVVSDPQAGVDSMKLLINAHFGAKDIAVLWDWAQVLDRSEKLLASALASPPPVGWKNKNGDGLSPAAQLRLAQLAKRVKTVRAQVSLPLVDLLQLVIEVFALDVQEAVSGQETSNLRAFLDVAAQFDHGLTEISLPAFLEWVEYARSQEGGFEVPPAQTSKHAVQVLTMHAAKGLEWDQVVVAGMSDGVITSNRPSNGWLSEGGEIPSPMRKDEEYLPQLNLSGADTRQELSAALEEFKAQVGEHQLAEDRRLAYVAFTRAKKKLLLTGHYRSPASNTVREPSVFLSELIKPQGRGSDVEGSGKSGETALATVLPQDYALSSAQIKNPWTKNPEYMEKTYYAELAPDITEFSAPVGSWWQESGSEEANEFALKPWAAQVATDAKQILQKMVLDGGSEPSLPGLPSLLEQAGQAGGDPQYWAELLTEHVPGLSRQQIDSISVLLAREHRAIDGSIAVQLPAKLGATGLARVSANADYLLQLRRPIPAPPASVQRLGTVFHQQIARYPWRQDLDALLSVEEAGQELSITSQEADLLRNWQANAVAWVEAQGLENLEVESQYWYQIAQVYQSPVVPSGTAREVDNEQDVTPGAGVLNLDCRLDAVFQTQAGQHIIVDWKTGSIPGPAELAEKASQLGIYRLAYAQAHGLELDEVQAHFVYVKHLDPATAVPVSYSLEQIVKKGFTAEHLQQQAQKVFAGLLQL